MKLSLTPEQHRLLENLRPKLEAASERKALGPSDATSCSRSSDTPYSELHCWYYDASEAESRARREMTGYHVRLSAAQEMERRLHVIASDAACVNDEWLAQQGEGIRAIIANIRRHANLSENAGGMARELAAQKPESITDLNG